MNDNHAGTPVPEENHTEAKSEHRTIGNWWESLRNDLAERFSLAEDSARQEETVEMICRGVEFRGTNLWVLIFATMIASLGLNVNSAAVIIGAMLVSPLMGPIMGVGLSLGINDFELLKRSLRNFSLMVVVAIATSTLYFFLSPLGTARSELLARTVPTTYDVLIAFFGGLAGIVAQSRKDRNSTVIPGVAIATALMPPLCTAGFGIATGQFKFFMGAFYLFFINTVFIALATFLIVRMLKYDKKKFLDPARERYVRRIMMLITLVTFIPSVVIGFHMVRVSFFESAVDRYVDQVFRFEHTRVIECNKSYGRGDKTSRIELLLIGEALNEEMIGNARAQLSNYGLQDVELIVRQASSDEQVDLRSLQMSYSELLEEKNRQINELKQRLTEYISDNRIEYEAISREAGVVMPGIGAIALSECPLFDASGKARDTVLICMVESAAKLSEAEIERLRNWLTVRTGMSEVKLYIE